MSKIAIVTSVMGGYDALREQKEQSIPVDWICFTDREPKIKV